MTFQTDRFQPNRFNNRIQHQEVPKIDVDDLYHDIKEIDEASDQYKYKLSTYIAKHITKNKMPFMQRTLSLFNGKYATEQRDYELIIDHLAKQGISQEKLDKTIDDCVTELKNPESVMHKIAVSKIDKDYWNILDMDYFKNAKIRKGMTFDEIIENIDEINKVTIFGREYYEIEVSDKMYYLGKEVKNRIRTLSKLYAVAHIGLSPRQHQKDTKPKYMYAFADQPMFNDISKRYRM